MNLRPDSNKTGRIYYPHKDEKFLFSTEKSFVGFMRLCSRDVLESSHNRICQNTLQCPNSAPFEIQLLGIKLHLFKTQPTQSIFIRYNTSTLREMIENQEQLAQNERRAVLSLRLVPSVTTSSAKRTYTTLCWVCFHSYTGVSQLSILKLNWEKSLWTKKK